jgi:hypothetical protein
LIFIDGRWNTGTIGLVGQGKASKYSLWPKQQDLQIDFTDKEWMRLGDLFRQVWDKPEMA